MVIVSSTEVFGVIFPLGNPALAGHEVNTPRSGAKRNTAKRLPDWQRLWKVQSMKPTLQISDVLEHWNQDKRYYMIIKASTHYKCICQRWLWNEGWDCKDKQADDSGEKKTNETEWPCNRRFSLCSALTVFTTWSLVFECVCLCVCVHQSPLLTVYCKAFTFAVSLGNTMLSESREKGEEVWHLMQQTWNEWHEFDLNITKRPSLTLASCSGQM